MNPPGASASLLAHIALLAIISFGGVPGVLPDLRDFVVTANGWLSDRDFANCFAVVQAIPGPNMILMMSFIGWRVGGLPVAIASAPAGPRNLAPTHTVILTTFGPGMNWQKLRMSAKSRSFNQRRSSTMMRRTQTIGPPNPASDTCRNTTNSAGRVMRAGGLAWFTAEDIGPLFAIRAKAEIDRQPLVPLPSGPGRRRDDDRTRIKRRRA